MTTDPHVIYNNNGQPFTDPDAAAYKARILSEEVGEWFIVVSYEGGGYVVQAESAGVVNTVEPELMHFPRRPQRPDDIKENRDAGHCTELAEAPDMTGLPDAGQHADYPHFQEDVVMTHDGMNNTESLTVQATKSPAGKNTSAQQAKQEYSPVFCLRPALRSYYLQYLAAFFGMVIYARPTWILYLFMTEQELFFSERQWVGEVVPDSVSMVGLALALLSLGRVLFDYLSHRWTVGEDFIEAKIGLLSRREGSGNIQIADVQSFYPRQSVIQSIFLGIGNIELGTAGTAGIDVSMKNVLNPEELILELKKRKKLAMKKRFQPR